MQTNDIYNTCLDISNVLNAGDISNAKIQSNYITS